MGSGSSREEEPSFHSDSASWSGGAYAQPPYGQGSQSYVPQQSYSSPQYHPPSENYHGGTRNGAKFERRYSRIADNYKSLEEVTKALARAGLESSNLIIGIDFTKSNEWTGEKSYNKRSLHDIRHGFNPYEQAVSIVGKTMSAFDDDNLIPCFGFGDASTHDQDVFSFFSDGRFCNGFEEVLSRYREIVPHLRLAGPTSFAPVIEMATTIVEQSGGQYHVLLIIADGQVTRSVDTERGRLSPQEQRTVDAIVEASKFPLSIILVGVGDGPWDMMREFDDNIPARAFDNFQFVNFTDIMLKNVAQSRKETEFALAALMEIPSQYKATLELNLLGSQKGGRVPQKIPLPPPAAAASLNSLRPSQSFKSEPSVPPYVPSYPAAAAPLNSLRPSQSFKPEPSVPSYVPSYPVNPVDSNPLATAPSLDLSSYDNQFCSICLSNPKDLAFGCGHQTCTECGQDLQTCPFCRGPIHTRLKLYS